MIPDGSDSRPPSEHDLLDNLALHLELAARDRQLEYRRVLRWATIGLGAGLVTMPIALALGWFALATLALLVMGVAVHQGVGVARAADTDAAADTFWELIAGTGSRDPSQ